MVTGGFESGVHVRGPNAERDFIAALSGALSAIGGLRTFANDAPPRTSMEMDGGGASFPVGTVFVSVMIGIKPVPILPLR